MRRLVLLLLLDQMELYQCMTPSGLLCFSFRGKCSCLPKLRMSYICYKLYEYYIALYIIRNVFML